MIRGFNFYVYVYLVLSSSLIMLQAFLYQLVFRKEMKTWKQQIQLNNGPHARYSN